MEKIKSECPQCGLEWSLCLCPSWPLKLIRFARPQVFWLLKNGLCWPEGTPGFTDNEAQHQSSQRAPGEAVSDVIAEIEARLKCCGDAGEALQDEALRLNNIEYLSRPAKRALNYCSGWNRRRISFSLWCWRQERSHVLLPEKPAPLKYCS